MVFADTLYWYGRANPRDHRMHSSPTHISFLSGLDLYAHRLDKEYSLVDCISMSVMRDEGMYEVLASDHHLTQEGFNVLTHRQPEVDFFRVWTGTPVLVRIGNRRRQPGRSRHLWNGRFSSLHSMPDTTSMLTQEQIDFFHTNGFLIMRGLIAGEELARLRAAGNEVVAEGEARQGTHHLYHTYPDGREVYRRSERMWARDDVFQAVTVHPDLLENIGQCIGQAFYPWNDSLVVKVPDAGAPVPWHQDPPYGRPERAATYPVPNFTTDIYLDHSGPDNGCVYAIPGHHLVGHVSLNDKDAEKLFTEYGALPLEMEPGDVLFHCLSVPHGSRASRSPIQRSTFYVHYLADEVYWDGYSAEPWAKEKPGWNPGKRAQIEEMIARRAAFGWESPLNRETLIFDAEGGFTFVGQPTTPLRHWEALAAVLSPEQFAAMKRLER